VGGHKSFVRDQSRYFANRCPNKKTVVDHDLRYLRQRGLKLLDGYLPCEY